MTEAEYVQTIKTAAERWAEFVGTKEAFQKPPSGAVSLMQAQILEEYFTVMHQAYRSMRTRFKASGIEQDDIARVLNCDKSLVSRRIHGEENITLKTLSFMATALGCRLQINFIPFADLGAPSEDAAVVELTRQEQEIDT